jgi:branched-chain amino acid transport system permease protein/neutral amino acid transport system permease protein
VAAIPEANRVPFSLSETVRRMRTYGDVALAITLWVLVPFQAAAWAIYGESGSGDLKWEALSLPLLALAVPITLRYGDALRPKAESLASLGLAVNMAVFVVGAFAWERDGLVTGVVSGSLFALGAIGITLIYGILKFGHFAHGDSMMLSAYLAFMFLTGDVAGEAQNKDVQVLPFSTADLPGAAGDIWRFSFGYSLLLAMGLAALIMAGLLIALDRTVYGPLRRRGSGIVTYSIASLGLALVIRSLMLIFWGSDPRFYSPGIRRSTELPFEIHILYDQIFILGMAFAMMAALYLLLYRTKLGKSMRAMSDNADLSRICGINTEHTVMWTWAVSGAFVAIAGVMLGLQTQLRPELGFIILLPLFASAILGGVGSPQGALIGGLLIGIVQETSVTTGIVDPGYKFSVAAIVLIVILLVRPRGLFGRSQ